MSTKQAEVKCDGCGTVFEANPHSARKGELHATYLQCPVCYAVFPGLITDRALRKLMRDSSPAGFRTHKQHRAAQLKKKYGEDLKQMDGWTEERQG